MSERIDGSADTQPGPSWLSAVQEVRLTTFVLASTAVAIGLAFWHDAWIPGLAGLFAAPLYLTYRSYRVFQDRIGEERRRVLEESSVQFAIIEALASAIEAKEPKARSNLRHLQVRVECLARHLGMSDADVDAVLTAALLHDIGNLAVPEHVLRKKEPLTAEELEKVRSHARIGANLLASVPFPRPVAPLVLAHHERWDGKGYPNGLAGEAIPLGARILAVADVFTALQADRPHRPALPAQEALAVIRGCSGESFDPRVVDALTELQPVIERKLREQSDSVQFDTAANAIGVVARVYDEITAAHQEAEVLQETALALGSSQGVFETMMRIWLTLQETLPVSCCALFLWDEEAGRFECRFAAGENDEDARRITSTTVDGLARPLAARTSFFTPADWSVGLDSSIACPLSLDGRVFGALALYDVGQDAYTDEHRRLVARLAQQATLVLRNAMTFDEMQSGSLTDALTSLPNRRGMQHYLNRELTRAQGVEGVELALLVADLDGFKAINDTRGHDVGDRAIQVVARTLRSVLHPDDLCARFAGDEFVIALRGCGRSQADRTVRAIREAVSSTPVEVEPGDSFSMAISIGVSVFPHDGLTLEQLFAAADRRMYEAKTGSVEGLDAGAAPTADPAKALTAQGGA